MKGVLAPGVRLKLHDVVNKAREHLQHNRVRIEFRESGRDAGGSDDGSGVDGADEPPAVFTDDLLGAILGNSELCEHLGLRPAEIVGRMQLFEGLAINFVYDMGARSNKVLPWHSLLFFRMRAPFALVLGHMMMDVHAGNSGIDHASGLILGTFHGDTWACLRRI